MGLMFYANVTRKQFESFLYQLTAHGHEVVCEEKSDDMESYYVKTNGVTNINYAAMWHKDENGRRKYMIGQRIARNEQPIDSKYLDN